MADFAQFGLVPTLHNLRQGQKFPGEAVMATLARKRPVGLVLPALYSEFERPAIYHMLDELKSALWLRRVVLVLSDANESEYERVRRLLDDLPVESTVLWREGPQVQRALAEVNDSGLPASTAGKGRACWLALGYLLAQGDCEVFAFQDCDIKTYELGMLERLVYPLLDPEMNFEFAKAYYPRITHRMNGRVTRLFATPLIQALMEAGVQSPFLRFLESFRYVLSGEIAMSARVARAVRLSPGWGLEISTLAEVYRSIPLSQICQVDISDAYDHKHQELSAGNSSAGLHRMAREIALAMFQGLGRAGVTLPADLLQATLPLAYESAALGALRRYSADSAFNQLAYDRHSEECAVEVFRQALSEAAGQFAADPMGMAPLPSWERVREAAPAATEWILATEQVAAA